MINALLDPNTVIVILDASIKNNVTTSIAHVHSFSRPIRKILYHVINTTSIEVELFAIRCGISQAVQTPNIFYIIIITGALYVV